MFVNRMPRYEILSPDAIETLDKGWRRIVSEIGVEFILPEAVEIFAKAGQKTEGDNVWLDPDFVLEQVAKAPREFDVQARNPEHTIHIGGDHMAFASVYGPPFVREGETRRDATMQDFERFAMLSQSFEELDSAGGTIVEPNDRPLDSRHLDMVFALQTLTDKPYMGSVTSGPNAADTVRMTEMLLGGRESIEATPGVISLINVNSPLRYDDRMLASMFEYVRAGQPVVITPFLLMGAMSPVTVPATLVQQMAEGLAGIALAQLLRPGAPVIFGSFLSNTDMQSGSPSFGTPESAIGLLCTGQIARHFGLPWRSGGGFTQQPDGRRTGRLRGDDDDAADVPGGDELGDALGRVAGVGAGLVLREVRGRHRDPADAEGGVHAARDRRGVAGVRRPHRGRRGRALPGRGAHAGAVPRVLLPAAAVLDGELRALEAAGRARHDDARGRDLAGQDRGVRAARRSTRRCASSLRST